MGASFIVVGALVPMAPNFGGIIVAIAFAIGGFGNAMRNVAVRTILHSSVAPEFHGRAVALYGSGARVAKASGFLVGGSLGASRVLLAYLISGAVAVLAAAAGAVIARGDLGSGCPDDQR